MKQKNRTPKLGIQAMLDSIATNPQPFWAHLQSCKTTKRREALCAWHAAKEQAGLDLTHPLNQRIDQLLHFEGLRDMFLASARKSLTKIHELSPPLDIWIKAVLLPIELQFNPIPKEEFLKDPTLQILRQLRGSNRTSLSAAKILLEAYKATESDPQRWSPDKWPELQAEARQALNLLCDLDLIDDMIDSLLHTDANVELNPERDHLTLRLSDAQLDLTQAMTHKKLLQSIYNQRAAQDLVSKTDFFERVDAQYKTSQGFPSCYSSPDVEVTPGNPGHVAIQLPKDCFYTGDDPNSPEAKAAHARMEEEVIFADHAYHFRQLLASNLFVREKENFKAAVLFQEGKEILTFYDFFVCLANVAAYFHAIRRFWLLDSWKGLMLRLKHHTFAAIQKGDMQGPFSWPILFDFLTTQSPETSPEDWNLGDHVNWDDQSLVNIARRVDDLDHLSPKLILHCFELLDKQENPFFAPLLIRNGNGYTLPMDAWSHPDLMQWLFEDFYTAYVYDSGQHRSPEERKQATQLAKLRESQITHDIAKQLQALTPFTASGAAYRHQDPKGKLLEGECDAIAWFPQESALLIIQMKLSNTTKPSHQKRKQWISTKLQRDAAAQVTKDRKWLTNPNSRQWLQDILIHSTATETPLSPDTTTEAPLCPIPDTDTIQVHHLILTDNYYHDHQRIHHGDGNPTIVLSLFEFSMLLRNEDIFEPLSRDWFRERLIRIAQHHPDATPPHPHTDPHAMSMAANQPDSAERAALQAFIQAHPTQGLTQIATLQDLLHAIESHRFWSLLTPFFGTPPPRTRELICLSQPHWRELVG